MNKRAQIIPTASLESRILTIRGQKVLLDSDLAAIYGVTAKRLNEQCRRNAKRFPSDFLFQLTREEFVNLRSQNATSGSGYGGRRFLPYAFTENGAVMAANVLNSPSAVRMSVFVVRAFVRMRELLAGSKEMAVELKKLEAKLTARLDVHETAIRPDAGRWTDPVPLACGSRAHRACRSRQRCAPLWSSLPKGRPFRPPCAFGFGPNLRLDPLRAAALLA